MLGVRLEAVDTSEGKVEKIGTCDHCKSSQFCENPIWTLGFPDGNSYSFEGYRWYYGSYRQIEVDDYLSFAEWLPTYDFNMERFLEDNYEYMERIADYFYPNSRYYVGNQN